MASRFIGINRGQSEFSVVEAASTNSTDVELRVDTGKNLTKNEVRMAMIMIENYLLKNTTIPPSNVPAV